MSNSNHTLKSYHETSVTTSNPAQLLVMLYEGAVRSLKQSVIAIKNKDLSAKRQSIDRAMAIVQHLQGTLDMQRGGQIAADLDRLYDYVSCRILDGSTKLNVLPIEEAAKLLSILLASWEEVVRTEQRSFPIPELVPARHGTTARFQMHA